VRIRVDCRVVAATNRDLQKEVRAGRFREDLFYRLNVIALRVPPLRERPEDIAALAEAFRERYARELKREGVRFHPRTLELLERCAWPGNVRQLKNAIERMVVLAPSDLLTPELLPPEVLDASDGGEASDLPYKEALLQFRRRLVWSALTKTGGNQTRAAEMLGLQRTYLNRLIRELGSPDSDSPEL
jgi:DNA-binding NtrC family response regulator